MATAKAATLMSQSTVRDRRSGAQPTRQEGRPHWSGAADRRRAGWSPTLAMLSFALACNTPTRAADAPDDLARSSGTFTHAPTAEGDAAGQNARSAASDSRQPSTAGPLATGGHDAPSGVKAHAWVASGDLDPATAAELMALPSDPVPRTLGARNGGVSARHYYCSDEWHPELFHAHIDGLGGALISIGSDQGYMLASWAKPEIAFLVDYDPEIVAVHEALDALILDSTDASAFRSLFTKRGPARALARLEALGVSEAARGAFERAHRHLVRRFSLLPGKVRGAPLWTRDQSHFLTVKEMLRQGRIRHGRVDLNGGAGLAAIAAFLHARDVPVRVIYMSNAEEYWRYGEAFRSNIGALPFDERSVVLRTIATHTSNNEYYYNVHEALDYQRRLAEGRVRKVTEFVDIDRARSLTTVELERTPRP